MLVSEQKNAVSRQQTFGTFAQRTWRGYWAGSRPQESVSESVQTSKPQFAVYVKMRVKQQNDEKLEFQIL